MKTSRTPKTLISDESLLEMLDVMKSIWNTGEDLETNWQLTHLSKIFLRTIGLVSNQKLPNNILRDFLEGRTKSRRACLNELRKLLI